MRAQRVKKQPEIKSKSKVRIEQNIEKSYLIARADLNTVLNPRLTPKIYR